MVPRTTGGHESGTDPFIGPRVRRETVAQLREWLGEMPADPTRRGFAAQRRHDGRHAPSHRCRRAAARLLVSRRPNRTRLPGPGPDPWARPVTFTSDLSSCPAEPTGQDERDITARYRPATAVNDPGRAGVELRFCFALQRRLPLDGEAQRRAKSSAHVFPPVGGNAQAPDVATARRVRSTSFSDDEDPCAGLRHSISVNVSCRGVVVRFDREALGCQCRAQVRELRPGRERTIRAAKGPRHRGGAIQTQPVNLHVETEARPCVPVLLEGNLDKSVVPTNEAR